jgi:hypothetical protein
MSARWRHGLAAVASMSALVACLATIDRSRIPLADDGPDDAAIDRTTPTVPIATDAPASAFDCDGATFCDGFEHIDPLGSWDEAILSADASVAPSTARARTGAYGLAAIIPAGRPGTGAAFLRTPPQEVGRVTSVRYAAFVEEAFPDFANGPRLQFNGAGEEVVELYVVFRGSTSTVDLNLHATRGAATDAYIKLTSAPLERGRWVEALLTVDGSDATAKVSFVWDGKTVIEGKPIEDALPDASRTMELGLTYATPGVGARAAFDELRLDIQR